MSEDLVAIPQISPAPPASDYDAIFVALMQSERGRWFLQEYARRNRSADTKLLLSAIERIELAVCGDRSRPVQQNFRSDLMEMAEAITQTRAEVAEFRAEGSWPGPRPLAAARQPQGDIFAAAERIRDVTWAMRGHGFDPSTCEQLEELAATILSASALRDPTDRRARKLGEVLQYLEQRIAKLIDSCAEADAPASPLADRAQARMPNGQAHEPIPNGTQGRLNGATRAAVTPNGASVGAEDVGSPRIRIPGSLTAVHDDIGEDAAAPTGVADVMQVERGDDVEKSDPALEMALLAAADDASSAPRHTSDALAADAPTASADRAYSTEPGRTAPAALPAAPAPPVIAVEPIPPALARAAEAAIAAFSAELAGLAGASPAPQPPPPPQRPIDDPLAPLRAMSPDELIAVFS